MSLFLRAKAWHLFAVMMISFFAQPFMLLAESARSFKIIAQILMIIMMLALVGWLFSIGKYFNSLVRAEIRMPRKLFGLGLGYALGYMIIFSFFFVNGAQGDQPNAFALILPFHLLAMVAMFYGLYFSSRNLVMAERQAEVTFYDYCGPFFLMWFFPIGVWFIQPRIHKIMRDADVVV